MSTGMRPLVRPAAIAAALIGAALVPQSAAAHGGVSCPAAKKSERQPPTALTAKLKQLGWTVRKLQMSNGCYEVYGFDDKAKPIEALFDPRTLERVAAQP